MVGQGRPGLEMGLARRSSLGYLPCLRRTPLKSLPTARQSNSMPADGALGLDEPPARNRLAELSPNRSPDVKDLAFRAPRLAVTALAATAIARGVILVRMGSYIRSARDGTTVEASA